MVYNLDIMYNTYDRLNRLYERIIKQTDAKGFFTLLYNYLELIFEDNVLYQLVEERMIKTYSAEYSDKPYTFDKNELKNREGRIKLMRFVANVTSEHKAPTRLYFCLAQLAFFYRLYGLTPKQRVAEAQLITEARARMERLNEELNNIFKLNDDSQNKRFNRSNYQLYLDVFHDQLMALRTQYDEPTQNARYIGKAQKSPSSLALEPSNYDPASGILNIGGDKVRIIRQPNKLGKTNESKEARLMRLVFHDVNTLHNGATMRNIISVRSADFKPKHRKLVNSYVKEINKKVQEETRIIELLICNQQAVMVNSRYLK